MRDPYAVLGVAKAASAADIKSAFRKLAKKYHPDANPDDATAKERFAEVSRAYEIVGDDEKRARFDRGEIDAQGNETFQGYPGGNGFTGADGFAEYFSSRQGRGSQGAGMDAEDILSQMFGGAFGGGGRSRTFSQADINDIFGDPGAGARAGSTRRAKPAKGADISVDMPVTVAEIIEGGKVKLALPDGRAVAVALPKGVENGQVIRLKGQGQAGQAGHRGDLLAKVIVKPEPGMRVDGHSLTIDVEVDLKTAIAGGKVAVPTPNGRIALKIAPWTNSGQKLRVGGRGLPDTHGKRGDLYAIVHVTIDPDDRPALESLFAQQKAD